jgi:hypothetical protein
VFQVTRCTLYAFSADKGEKLLELKTGVPGGMGPPITFMVDGKQYVALQIGTGRAAATGFTAMRQDGIVPTLTDVPHGQGAGPANATRPANRDDRPVVNPKLLVYALDGTAQLP